MSARPLSPARQLMSQSTQLSDVYPDPLQLPESTLQPLWTCCILLPDAPSFHIVS